ncbi:V-type ATP synthase subunit E family protein [Rhodococcus sp. X156]|uniref:V-type ATP synthase subunit E family protein n=1 Tax=Rhodococcus sp. X156 TaxID=2499145 RepID=UPI000FD8B4D2|nr:V-type ATP synthase subunit E family protein [Rhodococcus sp. X156]
MSTPVRDPLEPVRRAVLDHARAEAETQLAAAREHAAQVDAQARRDAEAVVAAARREGEAEAAALQATARSRARRDAREVVLAARQQAYDDLRAQVRAALPALREDPAFPAWRQRLVAHARQVLGEHARISEPPEGGVRAEADGRLLVLTLDDVAAQVLEGLGSEVEGLWATDSAGAGESP